MSAEDSAAMDWPLHVINLADNTTRRARVAAEFARVGLEFERIDAVYGKALSPIEIAAAYDRAANARRFKQDLVAAEIGCYLSHIAAWRAIVASGAPGGFVFEDDLSVGDALPEVLAALRADQSGWDIVKLFTLRPELPLRRPRALTAQAQIGTPARVPSMMLGYGIRAMAAQALLAQVPPFFRPIDEDQKFTWEHGLRIDLVAPSPIGLGDQTAETGTIGGARRAVAGGGAWRKLRYQAGYQLRLALGRVIG